MAQRAQIKCGGKYCMHSCGYIRSYIGNKSDLNEQRSIRQEEVA